MAIYLFFLYRKASRGNDSKLDIVSTTDMHEYLHNYYKHSKMDKLRGKVNFFQLSNGEQYNQGDLSISAFKVNHCQNYACNGYIIEFGNKTIGASGDTKFCDGIISAIPQAQIWIIDCSREKSCANSRHMSLQDVQSLAKQYPDKIFYGVHRKDWDAKPTTPNLILPNDGESFSL